MQGIHELYYSHIMVPCRIVPETLFQISDFGMSHNLINEDYYVSRGGKVPVKWIAPEVSNVSTHGCSYSGYCFTYKAIYYKKYSTASDVWSFGCVMYEIWSLGHKPFEDHTNIDVSKFLSSY